MIGESYRVVSSSHPGVTTNPQHHGMLVGTVLYELIKVNEHRHVYVGRCKTSYLVVGHDTRALLCIRTRTLKRRRRLRTFEHLRATDSPTHA